MMNKNKKIFFTLMLLMLVTLAGSVSCRHSPVSEGGAENQWRPPRPFTIKTKDGKNAMNVSLMTWTAEPDEKGSMTLLCHEKDILSVSFSKGGDVWFPYLLGDGASCSVMRDNHRLLLGGERIAIDLSADPTGSDWISKASAKELAALRICVLEGPIGGVQSPLNSALLKLSRTRPDMGWMVKGSEALRHVLNIFNPHCLLIHSNTTLYEDDLDLISNEPNLEYLWLSARELKDAKFLPSPKKLRTLVIRDWDPGETGPLPGDLNTLRSLTLSNSTIKDLSWIASLRKLDELHLVSCSDLSDISELSGFSSLKALSLANSKKISDLSVLKNLKELKGLKWLSFPPVVSQEQFDHIIRAHPDLQVLELIECKNIKDLTLLRTLARLESLVLLESEVDCAPLCDLKNLRFLALPKKAFEKTTHILELQKAQPACLIVQAEPFCLGSGWILLLWPAVFLGWYLSDRILKKRPPPIEEDV
ncbi:MAG: leucine-rich repeat domain-containing protein [Thermodesulfobacteriota bacterium]|nr:leucine-rich repeat domain-containing protein [Thermodesulfobacteriota bacterium]